MENPHLLSRHQDQRFDYHTYLRRDVSGPKRRIIRIRGRQTREFLPFVNKQRVKSEERLFLSRLTKSAPADCLSFGFFCKLISNTGEKIIIY